LCVRVGGCKFEALSCVCESGMHSMVVCLASGQLLPRSRKLTEASDVGRHLRGVRELVHGDVHLHCHVNTT
jgi:hypothetical protein